VTSVELDEDDVNYIETLIREERVRSLKEFVERCVKFGRHYTLDKWTPGIFHVGPLRVIIMPHKALTILTEKVPEDFHEDVGREFGEITKSFALFHHQLDTTKNIDAALEILSDTGLGQFILPNRKSIQVISPALPFEMMKSYLETVLGVRLEPVRMKIDVHLFNIVE